MKKSTKAALLSALVLPGVGHIYLKKYISGVILNGTSLFVIYSMFARTLESALQIAEKIQSGSVEPDVAAISALVAKQPIEAGSGAYLFDYCIGYFYDLLDNRHY